MAGRQGFAPIPGEPKASRDVTEPADQPKSEPKVSEVAGRQGFEPR